MSLLLGNPWATQTASPPAPLPSHWGENLKDIHLLAVYFLLLPAAPLQAKGYSGVTNKSKLLSTMKPVHMCIFLVIGHNLNQSYIRTAPALGGNLLSPWEEGNLTTFLYHPKTVPGLHNPL